MTYIPNRNYDLEVRRGNIAGHTMVSIHGHDDELTTTRTTVAPTVTISNIDQSDLASTAVTVDVASTDANDTSLGTGVRTVILEGLDANGDVQSETITMNGQTEVTSSNTYSAVNDLESLTWGLGTFNAGTLWVGNGIFTDGVPATRYFAMGIQQNHGLTAYYVVPTGKTLYFRQLTLNVGTSNKDVEFFIERSNNGTNWFTEDVYTMEPGEWQHDIIDIDGLPAGTHIRIEAISSSAGTDVVAVISCELVDD